MPILLNKTDPNASNARFERTSPLLIGSADDADLCLTDRSVSAHHCWIERHHDGFHLVDLHTTNGSHVNGRKASDALLRHGDVLRLGRVELEFQLTETEQAELGSAVAKQGEPSSLVKVETMPATTSASAEMESARRCAQCGAPIPGNANFCARCGLPTSAIGRPIDQFVQPVEGPGIRGPGILPVLALICGLVGPLLLGVGWLLGIILGLMALAIIRRTGGFERDRRQALWGIGAGVTWAVVLFLVTGSWWLNATFKERLAQIDKEIAENEQAVLVELASLARAEKYAKAILFADTNQNFIGEYVPLRQLAGLNSPFVDQELARDAKKNGYVFVVVGASEDGFFLCATPQRYGRTGRRTFAVDQTGALRGKDARGAAFSAAAQLPGLPLPNAFEKADDEIAEDALAVAKSLAKAGDYEKSRAILDGIRQNLTITKAAKQLTDLEKTIDPFLIEARADKKYRDAQTAVKGGDLTLAIALLRDIEVNYGTFSKIHDASRQRQELEVQFAQSQEEQAKGMFQQAEALEREGKVAEAETIYFQIEKRFPDTEWARDVLTLKPELRRQLREKQVEGWLQQLSNLSPESDFAQILNVIEQLRRNYADTDAYREATDSTSELQSLTTLEQKALAQKLKVDAMKQAQAGQPRRALTTLEKAVAEKPDLAVYLRETLWDLYPRVAEQLLKEQDVSGAMALYEAFLRLNPPEARLNRQLFADLSYRVAQKDVLGGRAEAALPRLQQAEAMYREDAEFNALYGRTLARLGRFEDAIDRLNAAAKAAGAIADPATPGNSLAASLYFWRAWTWLHWGEQLEATVRQAAELPTLADVMGDIERARTNRLGATTSGNASTNAAAQTNIVITLSTTPIAETQEGQTTTTNVFDTLLSGSLDLVADVEAARVDFSRTDLTTRGRGEDVKISARFEKAQRIQEFSQRVSRLRQLLYGEREHQRVVGENLKRLLDAYAKAQADLEQGARLNEAKNAPLAQNARLVVPKIKERAELYRAIVPALISARSSDFQIIEKSLELADQAVNQLQWNMKGGISISKAVEENFRRLGGRKTLDEAVAAFHRFDEKKLDLEELWRRNSLPEP